MSTHLTIAQLQAQGRLVPFVPRTRQPARRRLYLAQPAVNDLTNPQSATNILCGSGFIEASLTRWTGGDRVYGDRRRGRFFVSIGSSTSRDLGDSRNRASCAMSPARAVRRAGYFNFDQVLYPPFAGRQRISGMGDGNEFVSVPMGSAVRWSSAVFCGLCTRL